MKILAQDGNGCDCAEGKYEDKTGQVVETGLHIHSCEYIRLRDSFVGQAAAFADSLVPDDRGGQRWSRLFSRQMEKLLRAQEQADT